MARTRLHRRARGCDSLLLVVWKAPAGVLGNVPILVANKARQSMHAQTRTMARLGLLANGAGLVDVAAPVWGWAAHG